jgi:hypothetical protein
MRRALVLLLKDRRQVGPLRFAHRTYVPGSSWPGHDGEQIALPPTHHLSPPLAPRLDSPHPSSMRTRAADRLLLGMRGAAPEEGAGTTRPKRNSKP